MSFPAAQIETIQAWSSPLFVTTNPDHSFLKNDLLAYIQTHKQQQGQAIVSDVAVTAKHQLYESDLSFLTASEDPAVIELCRMFEELLAAVAFEVNSNHWPEGAEADQQNFFRRPAGRMRPYPERPSPYCQKFQPDSHRNPSSPHRIPRKSDANQREWKKWAS